MYLCLAKLALNRYMRTGLPGRKENGWGLRAGGRLFSEYILRLIIFKTLNHVSIVPIL